MIWIIIGSVACITLIICNWRDRWLDIDEKIFNTVFIMTLSVLVTFFVLYGASAVTSSIAEIDYEVASDTKIIALKDNQNVNGGFYILGGYVDEDLYYYYATETEFGYKTEKLKASNAYIKYTDGEAHIEEYVGDFVNKGAYFWGFPLYETRYVIHAPEGTITNEFNIDLE